MEVDLAVHQDLVHRIVAFFNIRICIAQVSLKSQIQWYKNGHAHLQMHIVQIHLMKPKFSSMTLKNQTVSIHGIIVSLNKNFHHTTASTKFKSLTTCLINKDKSSKMKLDIRWCRWSSMASTKKSMLLFNQERSLLIIRKTN